MRCPRLTTSSTAPTFARALARVAQVALLVLAACAPAGPRAVRYGEEACGYCRMTITDRRFGGQAASAHGRIEAFDAIECLADYVLAAPAANGAPRAWVADFLHPGAFIPVDSARFSRLAAASSPMGAGLAAVSIATPANAVPTEGAPMTWAELLASRRAARHVVAVSPPTNAAGAAHAE